MLLVYKYVRLSIYINLFWFISSNKKKVNKKITVIVIAFQFFTPRNRCIIIWACWLVPKRIIKQQFPTFYSSVLNNLRVGVWLKSIKHFLLTYYYTYIIHNNVMNLRITIENRTRKSILLVILNCIKYYITYKW